MNSIIRLVGLLYISELRHFGESELVIVLVGNKSDLGHNREVTEEEGQEVAEREGLCFMETSALENLKVEDAFLQMIMQIYEISSKRLLEAKINEASMPAGKTILNIDEVSETKQQSCCLG
uniref:Ras-related protein RABA6a-like n=1 Tax=Nelumbo nucifera TaxID=4432 RepID=A0A822YVV4_NELNU|nr:TPA_asm: hypothetical protein HUJ06_006321 [Nelumbo nucifera]